jgi:DNA-binding CsgD family transcriptional regulator
LTPPKTGGASIQLELRWGGRAISTDQTGVGGAAPDIVTLTERERECLRLVQYGLSSKEIARALDLSRHTVDHHLSHSMRKLSAGDRRSAARRLAAAEANDPVVRDWLHKMMVLVETAGAVLTELDQQSPVHDPVEHHPFEAERVSPPLELGEPGRHPDGGDGSARTHTPSGVSRGIETRRALDELSGNSLRPARDHSDREAGGDIRLLPRTFSGYELSIVEKVAIIAAMTMGLFLLAELALPSLKVFLHELSAKGAL